MEPLRNNERKLYRRLINPEYCPRRCQITTETIAKGQPAPWVSEGCCCLRPVHIPGFADWLQRFVAQLRPHRKRATIESLLAVSALPPCVLQFSYLLFGFEFGRGGHRKNPRGRFPNWYSFENQLGNLFSNARGCAGRRSPATVRTRQRPAGIQVMGIQPPSADLDACIQTVFSMREPVVAVAEWLAVTERVANSDALSTTAIRELLACIVRLAGLHGKRCWKNFSFFLQLGYQVFLEQVFHAYSGGGGNETRRQQQTLPREQK